MKILTCVGLLLAGAVAIYVNMKTKETLKLRPLPSYLPM